MKAPTPIYPKTAKEKKHLKQVNDYANALRQATTRTLAQEQAEWYEINAPFGRRLGYPECCIDEFCAQPPSTLKGNPTQDDINRLRAGCDEKNVFTGFIPCTKHAKQILKGEITLESLIKNREQDYPPFPITPHGI